MRSLIRIAPAALRRATPAAARQGHTKVTYEFHAPHVNPAHKYAATAFMTLAWFWVFYRAKHDGKTLLGLEHPWDGAHGDVKYVRRLGEPPSLSDDEE